ncbi:MFS transporter [Chloroflexota bacterium]
MNNREAVQSSGNRSSFFYGYVVVAVATIIMFANWGTFYSFGIFFKPVLTEFGWTRAMTSGAFSLATILQGIVAIPAGRLTDRFGPRIIITLVCLLVGLGYILMSQINSIWQLYIFYGIMIGMGMGGTFVPLLSTTARWFVARRGLMTGMVVAGIGAGAIIIPPMSNWLISYYDWRISYVILGSAILVISLPAAQFLRRDPTQIGQMPYGQREREGQQFQARARSVSFKKAVGTWQFWTVCGMFFCLGFCLYSIMVHIAPHATDLGISAANAANTLAIIGILSIVGKIGMGYVIDRIGSRKVWIIGFISMSIALFLLLGAIDIWMLYTFAAIFGFAYGACVAGEAPIVAELFGLVSHGVILGLATFSFTVGAALGPFQAGYIFDLTSSYQTAFLIFGVVAVLGLLLTAILKPISDKQIGD